MNRSETSFAFVDAEGSDFAFFDQGDGTDVGTAPAGVTVTIVPEPSGLAQAAAAVLALAFCARRRRGG